MALAAPAAMAPPTLPVAATAAVGMAMLTGELTTFSYWLLDSFPILARIG